MDTQCKAILELIQFTFLLVEVLNQATTSFLHFVQSALQPNPKWSQLSLPLLNLLILNRVLGVPHIVSNELFNLDSPLLLKIVIVVVLDFVY